MKLDALRDDSLNGWLLAPATNLVTFLGHEMTILSVTQRALVAMQSMPLLLSVLERHLPVEEEKARALVPSLIEFARVDRVFADEETRNDFRTVCSHHAVATWAATETTIEQTLINHIRKVENSDEIIKKSIPSLREKKLRTVTYNEAWTLRRQWERELPSPSTTMERALHMLGAFGMHVSLDQDTQRMLSELAELRNVILHNGGFIDQKFKNRCPWRSEAVGDEIRIDREKMSRYFDAACDFATKLLQEVSTSPRFKSSKRL